MQGAGEYGSASGVTFIKGTTIILDPASALYTAIGPGTCGRMCRALMTRGTRAGLLGGLSVAAGVAGSGA